MAPKLYTMVVSPPSRSALLTAKAINLDLEVVVLDPMKGEHLAPAFLEINPEHQVPTLVDDGFVLADSHAINAYLVEKYAKDDSLYPKDLKKRALINQRLNFNCGILQARMGAIVGPIFRQGAKTIPKDKSAQLMQAYSTLEDALQDKDYVAGDAMTIADFNIVGSISSCIALVPIAANRFPRISDWLSRMQSLPYYKEANQKGADMFAAFIKSRLA